MGIVARASPRGDIILVYLFGNVRQKPLSIEEVSRLRPDDAVLVVRAVDLHLIDGRWPIIGRDPAWQRSAWPVPEFVRRDELSELAWAVRYSDRDVNVVERETPVAFDTSLPKDAVYGAVAIELVLTRMLGSS